MMELLALIGLIVVALFAFHSLRRVGVALSLWGEAVLDRLSTSVPVAPKNKRRAVVDLAKKVEALKKVDKFPDDQEIKDEIDRLTSS